MTFISQPLRLRWRAAGLAGLLVALVLVLAGCPGGAAGPEADADAEPTRTPVPTFTSTPVGWSSQPDQPAAPAEPGVDAATPIPLLPTQAPEQEPPSPTPAEPVPIPTDTPVPAAQLQVTADAINVRRGPGTNYAVVGTANQNMLFEVLGKNPAGDWWQICCVNGEQGWIFGALAQVQNAEQVAVVQDLPAEPPTPVPQPPTPTPESQPQPQPQPVAGDPCANIGGDGCKFRVTGGPASRDNGGTELKLQFLFIHSGVDGGQPQGSYFVMLEKDGQRLPIADSVRSIALNSNEGALGRYNYEYKIGSSNMPGGSVEGNYVGWVLDGNGERDSQNFSFQLGPNQGEVWIQFDQA